MMSCFGLNNGLCNNFKSISNKNKSAETNKRLRLVVTRCSINNSCLSSEFRRSSHSCCSINGNGNSTSWRDSSGRNSSGRDSSGRNRGGRGQLHIGLSLSASSSDVRAGADAGALDLGSAVTVSSIGLNLRLSIRINRVGRTRSRRLSACMGLGSSARASLGISCSRRGVHAVAHCRRYSNSSSLSLCLSFGLRISLGLCLSLSGSLRGLGSSISLRPCSGLGSGLRGRLSRLGSGSSGRSGGLFGCNGGRDLGRVPAGRERRERDAAHGPAGAAGRVQPAPAHHAHRGASAR